MERVTSDLVRHVGQQVLRASILFFIFIYSFKLVALPHESIDSLIKDLYSDSFQIRSHAATALSGKQNTEEIQKIIFSFRKELSCVNEKPLPQKCHDPRFVYNVILVAGNLARKDRKASWEFLVHLWRGKTINEGSFFQIPEDGESFRGTDYFSPYDKTLKPNMEELLIFLEKTLQSSFVWATCKWPMQMIVELSKQKKSGEYTVYSYERDYSPEIQKQFKITNTISWIYRGEKKIFCGASTDVVDLKSQGQFGVTKEDNSAESLSLAISIFSLPENKALCSYVVDSSGNDPLQVSLMGSEQLIQSLFELSPTTCRPKKLSAYKFTPKR